MRWVSKKIYILVFVAMIILFLISFYLEKRYSPSYQPIARDVDYAQTNIALAQNALDQMKGRMRYNVDITTADVFDTEAIKIIKNKRFENVAEKEVDPFTKLAELAKTKKKTYVTLKESDLERKIAPNASSFEKLKVMEYNLSSSSSSISPIYAPCDFIVLTSSSSWESFKSSHKIRDEINTDLSQENIVVLISKSELPPGIFKISDVSYEKDTAVINYYVDVFEMAEENPDAKTNFYSVVSIPKKYKNIKIRQVR